MGLVTKPYSFIDGELAIGYNVDQTFLVLYNLVNGNIDSANILNGGIQTVDLADLAVTAAKLAANAVETDKIKDLAVTCAKLAVGAICSSDKLIDGVITTAKLADGAVTGVKLAPSSMGAGNLLQNPSVEWWGKGQYQPPDYWSLYGTGASVERVAVYLHGAYGAKVVRAGFDCYLYQDSIDYTYLKGREATFSMFVQCSAANRARISIDDGITTTYSNYHTGDGTWQVLTAKQTIGSAAGRVRCSCHIANTDGFAYFDAAMLNDGSAPFGFVPHPTDYHRYGIITATRDMTAASGNVSYDLTGFGVPKGIIALASIDAAAQMSHGMSIINVGGGRNDEVMYRAADGNFYQDATKLIIIEPVAGNKQDATTVSFDNDGFTLSWTKTGAPTGICKLLFFIHR